MDHEYIVMKAEKFPGTTTAHRAGTVKWLAKFDTKTQGDEFIENLKELGYDPDTCKFIVWNHKVPRKTW